MKLGDGSDGIFEGDQPTFAQAGPAVPGVAKLTPEEEELVAQEKNFMEGIDRGRGGVLGGAGGVGDSGEAVEAISDLADLVKELILEARETREVIREGQLALHRRLDELSGRGVETSQEPPQLAEKR